MYVAKNVFRGNLKSCFYDACGNGENRKIAIGFGNECVKYIVMCVLSFCTESLLDLA